MVRGSGKVGAVMLAITALVMVVGCGVLPTGSGGSGNTSVDDLPKAVTEFAAQHGGQVISVMVAQPPLPSPVVTVFEGDQVKSYSLDDGQLVSEGSIIDQTFASVAAADFPYAQLAEMQAAGHTCDDGKPANVRGAVTVMGPVLVDALCGQDSSPIAQSLNGEELKPISDQFSAASIQTVLDEARATTGLELTGFGIGTQGRVPSYSGKYNEIQLQGHSCTPGFVRAIEFPGGNIESGLNTSCEGQESADPAQPVIDESLLTGAIIRGGIERALAAGGFPEEELTLVDVVVRDGKVLLLATGSGLTDAVVVPLAP